MRVMKSDRSNHRTARHNPTRVTSTMPTNRSSVTKRIARALFACACASVVAVARAEAPASVTCGSALKLKHSSTKHFLGSQQVQYASGSGQQSVTARSDGSEDQYWILRGAVGEECERGSAIAHGQTVRLQHANTRAWLHSHEHRSPLSGQNEVSCFGSDESSDTGDNWIVEIPSGAGAWERGKKVRFKHADTGAYLHSHGLKFGRPIAGHQEVCAAHSSGSNAMWVSAEGVYFPTPEEEAAKDEL